LSLRVAHAGTTTTATALALRAFAQGRLSSSALNKAPVQYQLPSIWSNTSWTVPAGVTGAEPYADHVDHTHDQPETQL
jgi:hypothetical protein